MSTNAAETAIPPLEPVEVTLEMPGRLFRDYNRLVEAGLYLSVEEALRQAVIASWRHERGTYHTLRIDPADRDVDETDGQEPAPSAEA
jgi:Arc/MetJ-type ribon-helix-helix transcriptional regulator